MPADRQLVLAHLEMIDRSLNVAREHAEILRWSIEGDDVEGIVRGRLGLHNALELIGDEMGALARDLPDWRPITACTHHAPQPDGDSRPSPDAHLGGVEA